jgi:hypothetical protein
MPNPVNIAILTKINKTQLHLLDCKNGNEGTLKKIYIVKVHFLNG